MIISASRRTDIPAFYSDWFLNRLREGFLLVKNPFNANQVSRINLSSDSVECIVFWTKNPEKIVSKLSEVDRLGYKYYFQFTVNSYDKSIESNVPSKSEIIRTFRTLSDIIGSERVIWRYDPILLTDKFTIGYHTKWFDYIAQELDGYTNKCIISFVDMYKKCQRNMKNINLAEIDISKKYEIAKILSDIAKNHGLTIESCAEDIELQSVGIKHGKCIDDMLVSKIINNKISVGKDTSQRDECGCVSSIDVGTYNTCQHGCRYCYANYNQETVNKNLLAHDSSSPLLCGGLTGKEKITERKATRSLSKQKSLFE